MRGRARGASVTISDVRLEEILAGLEEATPGPWEVVGSSITDWGREWEASMSMEFIPNGHDEGMNSRSDADAAHIARCDPDTMRSILTELKSLREKEK